MIPKTLTGMVCHYLSLRSHLRAFFRTQNGLIWIERKNWFLWHLWRINVYTVFWRLRIFADFLNSYVSGRLFQRIGFVFGFACLDTASCEKQMYSSDFNCIQLISIDFKSAWIEYYRFSLGAGYFGLLFLTLWYFFQFRNVPWSSQP